MRCAVVQSSYIPWRGYFDLIRQADVFVFLDSVEFSKQDWRTRNKIKTAQGLKWLSVPVLWRGNSTKPISQIRLDPTGAWNTKHVRSIEQAYARAPFRNEVVALLSPIYQDPPEYLYQFNRELTQRLWGFFSGGAPKQFVGDETLSLPDTECKDERLISLCRQLGATRYLSGPSAQAYIQPDTWHRAGIELSYIDYRYVPYPQLHGPFEPFVSIVDTLMQLGPGSLEQALAKEDV